MLSDPERYGKSYVQRLAASMAVPALVAQTAQTMDPNLREARTIMDGIKARVPVLSQSAPVRRNVWGEPMPANGAIGPNLVSPFYSSNVSHDPLAQEIARLRVPLAMPQRHLTIEGKNVPLNAQQYDELVQLSGAPAKQYLERAMGSPEWRSMGDPERIEFVKDSLADFREAGRDALLERHPELSGAAPASAPPPVGRPVQPSPSPSLPPLPPGYQLAH